MNLRPDGMRSKDTPLRILYLEDEPRDLELAQASLASDGIVSEVVRVETREQFEKALEQGGCDLILSDKSLPAYDGLSALALARERRPDIPFIFVSGSIGEESAIETLKRGATDYVPKQRLARLAPVVRRALREVAEQKERRAAEQSLARNEQRFRELAAIVESSSDAIVSQTLDGTVVSWNSAASALFGYTAGEVLGRSVEMLILPAQREKERAILERLKLDNRGHHYETTRIRKDGAQIPVSVSIAPLRDSVAQVHGVATITRDISARQRAEATLYRAKQADTRDESASAVRELIIIFVLASAVYALGHFFDVFDGLIGLIITTGAADVQAIIATSIFLMLALAVFAYQRWNALKSQMSAHQQTEEALRSMHDELESRVRERTTELIRANVALRSEITEREQAEQALAASEQRFRALSENSADATALLSPDGTVLYKSPSTERILGRARKSMLPHNWLSRVDPDDLPRISQLFKHLMRTPGQHVADTMRYRHANGAWRWIEAVGTNLTNEPSVQGIVFNFRDITAHKEAEEETRRQSLRAQALAQTAARLNAQLDLATVLKAVCEETARALGVPATALRLYDVKRDQLRVARTFGLPSEFSQFAPSPGSLYQKLMQEQGDLIVALDVQTLPDVPNRDFYATFNIHTVVTAIMQRESQLIGGLSIFRIGETRPFGKDELELLRALAHQAAQAITNAQLLEATEHSIRRLHSLRTIDQALTASVDLDFTLNRVLEQATTQLQVDAADILQFNERDNVLQFAAATGFRSNAVRHTRLVLGEGYAGKAALEKRTIKVPNLAEARDGLSRAPLTAGREYTSYYAVPLVAKGQIKGVMEIFNRAPLDPDEEWEAFLEALAGQAAIAIDNGQLFNGLQHSNLALRMAYDSTLEGWVRALDLRDEETEGHTERVTELTLRLAAAMDVDSEELIHIRRGALLHDIGKMGVPDSILLKAGPLSDAEWVIMRKHPVLAYQLLRPIAYLRPALDIPYCHHEQWDGTGYPRGLKGEQIPLAARIFAVVDVYDTLHSDRPYRAAWTKDKVLEHIRSLSGTHFDPQVVDVFLPTVALIEMEAPQPVAAH